MMQASSPLAAMGGMGSSWGFDSSRRPGALRSCGNPFQSQLFGLASRQDPSYFDTDMTMTTSPTECLAVDLSQNFHIDKSPAFPTPRRSLFSNMAGSRPALTTPPLPPSSPCLSDIMDMSPLPHKTPFAIRSNLPSRMIELSSSPAPVDSPCNIQKRPVVVVVERKKSISITRRPSLARHKNYTTTTVTKVVEPKFPFAGDSPQFSFGGRNSAPPMELDEMFGPSPIAEEKKVGLGLELGGPLSRPKQPVFPSSEATTTSLNGSPVSRRSLQRPVRKVCRRSLSMFANAGDVMKPEIQEQEVLCAQSPSQVAAKESQVLPCFGIKDDSLKRITRDTMVKLLDGEYKHLYDEHLVVDCRFEYEYGGGHIGGAVNINSVESLDSEFISKPRSLRTLLVFHCEYSAHRAPRMALALRNRDRQVNMHRYPELYYPEVYILEGGYSGFYAEHKQRCEPQFYVMMDDKGHRNACEREMGKFRRNTKFGRAQSYTFGMAAQNKEESAIRKPMAPRRDFCSNIPYTSMVRPKFDPKRMASF